MSQYKSAYTGAQIDQAVEKVPQLEERVKAIEDNPPASTKEEIIENLGFTPVGYEEEETINPELIKSVWLKDPVTEEEIVPRTFTELIQNEKGENLERRLVEKEDKIARISYNSNYNFNEATVTVEEIFNTLSQGDKYEVTYDMYTTLGLKEYVSQTVNDAYGGIMFEKVSDVYMKIEFVPLYGDNGLFILDFNKTFEGYISSINTFHIGLLKPKSAGRLIANNSYDYSESGLQWFDLYTTDTSGEKNATPNQNAWYHILRLNHTGNNNYLVDLALPFGYDKNAAFRQIVEGQDQGWRYLLDSINFNSYAANKIIQGGNYTKGYIRFPDVKKQICWTNVIANAAFTTAWGTCYEFHDGNGIDLGNWSVNFNATPSVSYNVIGNSKNAGMWVSTYQKPSASHAGIVSAVRPNSYTTSMEIKFTAIGIGSYS